jgi:hypothetical protein
MEQEYNEKNVFFFPLSTHHPFIHPSILHSALVGAAGSLLASKLLVWGTKSKRGC